MNPTGDVSSIIIRRRQRRGTLRAGFREGVHWALGNDLGRDSSRPVVPSDIPPRQEGPLCTTCALSSPEARGQCFGIPALPRALPLMDCENRQLPQSSRGRDHPQTPLGFPGKHGQLPINPHQPSSGRKFALTSTKWSSCDPWEKSPVALDPTIRPQSQNVGGYSYRDSLSESARRSVSRGCRRVS